MPNQKQIAEHLDISQQEISKLMAELGIDWNGTDLATIRVLYIRKLRAVAAGHQSHDGSNLTHERVLSERLDRQLKELLLAEKRGQLINIAQLEPGLEMMLGAFKVEIMALPEKIKAELDVLWGISVDTELLDVMVHATLTQLATYDPQRGVIPAVQDAADAVPSDSLFPNPEGEIPC